MMMQPLQALQAFSKGRTRSATLYKTLAAFLGLLLLWVQAKRRELLGLVEELEGSLQGASTPSSTVPIQVGHRHPCAAHRRIGIERNAWNALHGIRHMLQAVLDHVAGRPQNGTSY